jgi:hypothetical protein
MRYRQHAAGSRRIPTTPTSAAAAGSIYPVDASRSSEAKSDVSRTIRDTRFRPAKQQISPVAGMAWAEARGAAVPTSFHLRTDTLHLPSGGRQLNQPIAKTRVHTLRAARCSLRGMMTRLNPVPKRNASFHCARNRPALDARPSLLGGGEHFCLLCGRARLAVALFDVRPAGMAATRTALITQSHQRAICRRSECAAVWQLPGGWEFNPRKIFNPQFTCFRHLRHLWG